VPVHGNSRQASSRNVREEDIKSVLCPVGELKGAIPGGAKQHARSNHLNLSSAEEARDVKVHLGARGDELPHAMEVDYVLHQRPITRLQDLVVVPVVELQEALLHGVHNARDIRHSDLDRLQAQVDPTLVGSVENPRPPSIKRDEAASAVDSLGEVGSGVILGSTLLFPLKGGPSRTTATRGRWSAYRD
jgi:hypothetical protein